MFYFDDFFGKKVLKSTLLDGCEHFFTTRDFVLHSGSCTDLESTALSNIEFLINNLNITKEKLYRCKQMHTANVEYASGNNNCYENTDGIILTSPNTATFLNFADCIPIILYDKQLNIGGVIHAGWRGTAEKIAKNAVNMMIKKGSNPKNISSAIGAGIGKCCFDVHKDVFDKIFSGIDISAAQEEGAYSYNEDTDKYFVDLKVVNKIILNQSSVTRIDISDYCTSCSNDVFFSYRKENGNTARHSAFLMIKEK